MHVPDEKTYIGPAVWIVLFCFIRRFFLVYAGFQAAIQEQRVSPILRFDTFPWDKAVRHHFQSIEASLSLKFGEMLTLMLAILLGIVSPLKPTVQLLNLFLTHVLCTWSFAFEEAEEYIMSIPPRDVKKDLDGGYRSQESLETWKYGMNK